MPIETSLADFLTETSRLSKEKDLLPIRQALVQRMKQVFGRQERIFLKGMGKYRNLFSEALGDSEFDEIMGEVIGRTTQDMGMGIIQASSQAMRLAAKQRIADFGIDIAFDLKNPRAVQWLTQNAALRVTQINEATRKEIASIVTQGTSEGWSYNRTAKEISTKFKEFRIGKPQLHIESRAHLVAVTESANAYEAGNKMVVDQMAEMGLEMEKKWLTVGDNRVSDGCAENQAEDWIPADQPHKSGDMHPPRFPGCRCDELYRRVGAGESIEAMVNRALEAVGDIAGR